MNLAAICLAVLWLIALRAMFMRNPWLMIIAVALGGLALCLLWALAMARRNYFDRSLISITLAS